MEAICTVENPQQCRPAIAPAAAKFKAGAFFQRNKRGMVPEVLAGAGVRWG